MIKMKTVTGASTSALLLILFVKALSVVSEESCVQSNGTTPNLREIIIGRCHTYFNILRDDCSLDKTKYDCEHIWQTFRKAVVGREPCDVKIEDYSELVKAVEHSIPYNKSLFWSGTYKHSGEGIF